MIYVPGNSREAYSQVLWVRGKRKLHVLSNRPNNFCFSCETLLGLFLEVEITPYNRVGHDSFWERHNKTVNVHYFNFDYTESEAPWLLFCLQPN